LSPTDRLLVHQWLEPLQFLQGQRPAVQQPLREFAQNGSPREVDERRLLRSLPGVGEGTGDVVLAELGDVVRCRSAQHAVADAGLAPGHREAAGKTRDLGITKAGSGLLRWVLVEAAWQAVRRAWHGRGIYERWKRRRGGRRAIVAVARRLLEVMMALLRSGQPDRQGFAAAA